MGVPQWSGCQCGAVGFAVVAVLTVVVGLIMMGIMPFNPQVVAEYMTYLIAGTIVLYFLYRFISPSLSKK